MKGNTPTTTKQAHGYPQANRLDHSNHPPETAQPLINMHPVTPAIEVNKHPNSPTRMMVLREGMVNAVVMVSVLKKYG